MNRSIRHIFLTATTACGLWLTPATAQTTATTDPVGAMSFELAAGADNPIAVPFRQPTVSDLVVSQVNDSGNNTFMFSFSDANFTEDQYSAGYYLQFASGPAAGEYYTIIDNGTGSVSVDSIGSNLASVAIGDKAFIAKYWTLSELFPPSDQGPSGPLVKSTGNLLFQRGSEVLMPDVGGVGINLSASAIYFVKSDGWYQSISGFPSADDVALLPDSFIFIRQPSSAGSRMLTVAGSVPMSAQTTFLATNTGESQDNFVSYSLPDETTLGELDLGGAFIGSSGNLLFQRKDELFLYPEDRTINPSAGRIFFRVNGEWRESKTGFPNADSVTIGPGTSFIIRKAATSDGSSSKWTYTPTYISEMN